MLFAQRLCGPAWFTDFQESLPSLPSRFAPLGSSSSNQTVSLLASSPSVSPATRVFVIYALIDGRDFVSNVFQFLV